MDWFATQLLNWYAAHGRTHFPWQHNKTPYRVWLSEVMLQQTQAATVIPYYERFLARFPDLATLANTTEDEVLALWTGLGYYARGRNLLRTAQLIVQRYNGDFPGTLSELNELPGIGRSTAGAILASGFCIRGIILEANVKRVLARFHAVEGLTTTSNTNNRLWTLAEQHTPETKFADYNQAIMDLGASVCGRKALCEQCPLKKKCQAYITQRVAQFPEKKKAKTKPTRRIRIFVINNQLHQLFLEKQPASGVWGGLWSPPIRPENFSTANLLEEMRVQAIDLVHQTTQQNFRHTFSHYHLDIEPVLVTIRQEMAIGENHRNPTTLWYNTNDASALGLSAVAVKLIQQFKDLL